MRILGYLKSSSNIEIRRLGGVLQDNLSSIGNPSRLFLFFWRDRSTVDGNEKVELIGATSPLTLVFTSPNWVRKLREYGWMNEFKRMSDNHLMFNDEDLQPLSDRTTEFRNMLFDFRMAYDLDLKAPLSNGLYSYLLNSIAKIGVWPAINRADFTAKYNCLSTSNGTQVVAGIFPVTYKYINPAEASADEAPSGYLMRPTTEQLEKAQIPLVLSDAGLPGVHYIGGSEWGTTKIDSVKARNTDVFQRTLPGFNSVQYPFVYVDDFLEDRIMKVSSAIDSSKFYTHTIRDNSGKFVEQLYLLPLKPLFFKFFRIEDMEEMISITSTDSFVTITIKVPIADSIYRTISLSKSYDLGHIHILSGNEIGFYPFYKVSDCQSLNKYAVVSSGTPTLTFQTVEGKEIVSSPIQRTQTSGIAIETNYYPVNEAFDYVIISDRDKSGHTIKGMIIPKFTAISIADAQSDYKFAIDFGTSNTMIAYNIDGGDEQALTVNVSDYLVMLHPVMDAKAGEYINRNFMPIPNGTNGGQIKFPIKTSVCECINYHANGNSVELFGKLNAGYSFMTESSFANKNDYFKYNTNLKWSLESDPGNADYTSRVRHYCMSLMWLLKNKVLMENGKPDFSVCLTFPESMIVKTIFYQPGVPVKTGMGAWQWAATKLGLEGLTFSDMSESEAPYYKLVNGLYDMLIVDIGGGTSDMFFVIRDMNNTDNTNTYYQSVRFAGNDIWGDGYGVGRAVADNGFVKYINNKLKDEGVLSLNETISSASSSADVMAVMFNRDAELLTSQKIMSNDVLRSVLLIHFTALLYHISRVIKKYDMPIPKVIAFSGMGSKYIRLINGEENRIKTFVKKILETSIGKQVPVGFTITFGTGTQAKENTALGAIKRDGIIAASSIYDLSRAEKESIIEQGVDVCDSIRYKDVFDDREGRIHSSSKLAFVEFIAFLRDDKFSRVVNDVFGFDVSSDLIQSLEDNGEQSFCNVKALAPKTAPNATVKDSLFFWFIKDGLYYLAQYANNAHHSQINK